MTVKRNNETYIWERQLEMDKENQRGQTERQRENFGRDVDRDDVGNRGSSRSEIKAQREIHRRRQSKTQKSSKRQTENRGREWETCGNNVYGDTHVALKQYKGLINWLWVLSILEEWEEFSIFVVKIVDYQQVDMVQFNVIILSHEILIGSGDMVES